MAAHATMTATSRADGVEDLERGRLPPMASKA
jgi:hypothetical protein